MEVVALQRQRGHLLVADLDALGVLGGVELGLHGQPGAGGGGGDELHDDLVAFQGAAAPVHGDVGEQPVLDFPRSERGATLDCLAVVLISNSLLVLPPVASFGRLCPESTRRGAKPRIRPEQLVPR